MNSTDRHRSWYTHPYLLLTLTVLFWSGNMVLGRAIRADVPPIALAFWRWLIALACVLPLGLPQWRSQWPILRRHWRPVVLLGVLGVGCYNTFAYISLTTTTATNAVLLNAFIPIATIALSWAFFGRRLHRVEAIGVVVSFIGAATIICRGDFANLASLSLHSGDAWMLAAVFSWALYTVGLQWRPAGVAPMVMLTALIVVGLLFLAPAYAWEIASGRSIHWSLPALGGMLYTGVFPAFLGYVFYNRAIGEVGANRGSLFIHLMPAFGVILSAIFLDERPALYHGVAIALIFAGIYLTTRARTT